MKQLLLSQSNNMGTGITAQYLAAYGGAVLTDHQTATNSGLQIPVGAGTLSNFTVTLSVAPGVGNSRTFTIRKNNTDSAITVTISGTSTTATDGTHTLSVAAGDFLAIHYTGSGTPASCDCYFSTDWDGTNSQECFAGGCFGTGISASSSAQNFSPLMSGYGVNAWGTALPSVASTSLCPISGTITALYVGMTTAPGTGTSREFSIYKNGSQQATSSFSIANAATTGNKTGLSIAISAGDLLALETTPTGTPSGDNGIRWVAIITPTTDGEWPMCSNHKAGSTSAARYLRVWGGGGTSLAQYSTESQAYYEGAVKFAAKKMYLGLDVSPGSTKSYAFKSRVGGADGNLSATISNAATTANDTTNADTVNIGTTLDVSVTPSGSPTAIGAVQLGMVATTNVVTTNTRTVSSVKANILLEPIRTVSSVKVNLKATDSRTVSSIKANLKSTPPRTVTPVVANTKATVPRTVSSVLVNLEAHDSRSVPAKVNLKATNTRTVSSALANLKQTGITRTISSVMANLDGVMIRSVPAKANLKATDRRTVAGVKVNLKAKGKPPKATTRTRTVSTVKANTKATRPRTVPAHANLVSGRTRLVLATANVKRTAARLVPATVNLMGTTGRVSAPVTVNLKRTVPRTVPAAANLSTTIPDTSKARTVTGIHSNLRRTNARTVIAAANLQGSPAVRTVHAVAANIRTSLARSVPVLANLRGHTAIRTVLASANLQATRARTLSGVAANLLVVPDPQNLGPKPKVAYMVDKPTVSFDGSGLVNRVIIYGIASDGGDLTLQHANPSVMPYAVQTDGSVYYIEDAVSIAAHGLYEQVIYRTDIKSPYQLTSPSATITAPGTPVSEAQGSLIFDLPGNPTNGQTFTISASDSPQGAIPAETYTFKTAPSGPGDILIGADAHSTLRNVQFALAGTDSYNAASRIARANWVDQSGTMVLQFASVTYGPISFVVDSGTSGATFNGSTGAGDTITAGLYDTLTANVLYAVAVDLLLAGKSEQINIRCQLVGADDCWMMCGDRVHLTYRGLAKTAEADFLGITQFEYLDIDGPILVAEVHLKSDPSGVIQREYVLSCPHVQIPVPALPTWSNPVALPPPNITGQAPPTVPPGYDGGYTDPGTDPNGTGGSDPAPDPQAAPAQHVAKVLNNLIQHNKLPVKDCCPETPLDVQAGTGLTPGETVPLAMVQMGSAGTATPTYPPGIYSLDLTKGSHNLFLLWVMSYRHSTPEFSPSIGGGLPWTLLGSLNWSQGTFALYATPAADGSVSVTVPDVSGVPGDTACVVAFAWGTNASSVVDGVSTSGYTVPAGVVGTDQIAASWLGLALDGANPDLSALAAITAPHFVTTGQPGISTVVSGPPDPLVYGNLLHGIQGIRSGPFSGGVTWGAPMSAESFTFFVVLNR